MTAPRGGTPGKAGRTAGSRSAGAAMGDHVAGSAKPQFIAVVQAQALPPSPARLRCGEEVVGFAYEPTNAVGYSVIGVARARELPASELNKIDCTAIAGDSMVRGTMLVLTTDPHLCALPSPRRKGILRGAAQIVDRIATSQTPSPLDWWTALQFAYKGYIQRGRYLAMAVGSGGSVGLIPGASERSELFVWDEYVGRMTGELLKALQRARAKNPYIDLVRLPRAMGWLKLDHPTVGALVLREAAQQLGTGVINTFTGPALRLPPSGDRPRDAEIATEILGLYERGEGMPLAKLQAAFPSKRPLIGKLVDAGLLVESPDGFIFTQRQLHDHLATLGLRSPGAEVPGVGDIKKRTGLQRKDAEQLRLLLLEIRDRHGGE